MVRFTPRPMVGQRPYNPHDSPRTHSNWAGSPGERWANPEAARRWPAEIYSPSSLTDGRHPGGPHDAAPARRSPFTRRSRRWGAWALGLGLGRRSPAVGPGRRRHPGQSSSNPRRTQIVEVVERVKDAVVNIHSERTVAAAAGRGPVRHRRRPQPRQRHGHRHRHRPPRLHHHQPPRHRRRAGDPRPPQRRQHLPGQGRRPRPRQRPRPAQDRAPQAAWPRSRSAPPRT